MPLLEPLCSIGVDPGVAGADVNGVAVGVDGLTLGELVKLSFLGLPLSDGE